MFRLPNQISSAADPAICLPYLCIAAVKIFTRRDIRSAKVGGVRHDVFSNEYTVSTKSFGFIMAVEARAVPVERILSPRPDYLHPLPREGKIRRGLVQTNTRNNCETNSIFLGYDIFRLILRTFLFSWDSFNLIVIYYGALPFTYAA
jgi:hypothetical protein